MASRAGGGGDVDGCLHEAGQSTRSTTTATTRPTKTTQPVANLGTLVADVTPVGWVPVGFGEAQLSVPADWQIGYDVGCPAGTGTGLILVGYAESTCPAMWSISRRRRPGRRARRGGSRRDQSRDRLGREVSRSVPRRSSPVSREPTAHTRLSVPGVTCGAASGAHLPTASHNPSPQSAASGTDNPPKPATQGPGRATSASGGHLGRSRWPAFEIARPVRRSLLRTGACFATIS
jgi:hypothetical protein